MVLFLSEIQSPANAFLASKALVVCRSHHPPHVVRRTCIAHISSNHTHSFKTFQVLPLRAAWICPPTILSTAPCMTAPSLIFESHSKRNCIGTPESFAQAETFVRYDSDRL